MATKRLNISEAILKELAADKSVTEINDPRFPLRFRYLANREQGSWYYVRGPHYQWIGRWPLVKLADIKRGLAQIEINFASGMNSKLAVIGHFETVSDLLKWHLDQTMKTRALSKARKTGIKSIIKCYLLPYIGDLPLVDVTSPILLERFFTPIQADYSISTVYLAWCVLKSAFNRSHEAGLMPANLIANMKVSDFVKEKIKPKPSKLEDRHLPVIFADLKSRKHSSDCVLALMMLLHGTRIGETRQARWDQFDFIDNTWNIPESITKGNSPALKVMLTETSVELLKQHQQWQRKRGYSGIWLFKGSERSAMTQSQANKAIQRVSDRNWTAHDLRKAYRDVLTEVDTDSFVAERMINHSLTSVQKTYNQKEQNNKAKEANKRAHQWIHSRI
ncbi:tyrosine-type recombinase/integrase [Vibrio aestuarianus]|uniref:tyrosine-type recombinase/integrase n=1 Tax=Vibrio aestuarianus TaxID=28171 RepID=UPI0015949939|nr:tyrosine-type recombinase/integrase [Vibrio aestuarianus]NGZ17997.1 tyrosine-type recombinase/integrase [Vibrio aestuarianus]